VKKSRFDSSLQTAQDFTTHVCVGLLYMLHCKYESRRFTRRHIGNGWAPDRAAPCLWCSNQIGISKSKRVVAVLDGVGFSRLRIQGGDQSAN
jgi:hypothetical protein